MTSHKPSSSPLMFPPSEHSSWQLSNDYLLEILEANCSIRGLRFFFSSKNANVSFLRLSRHSRKSVKRRKRRRRRRRMRTNTPTQRYECSRKDRGQKIKPRLPRHKRRSKQFWQFFTFLWQKKQTFQENQLLNMVHLDQNDQKWPENKYGRILLMCLLIKSVRSQYFLWRRCICSIKQKWINK